MRYSYQIVNTTNPNPFKNCSILSLANLEYYVGDPNFMQVTPEELLANEVTQGGFVLEKTLLCKVLQNEKTNTDVRNK